MSLLLLTPAQGQAPLNLRVALVIGNAAYRLAPLQNPTNDSRAMSETLKAQGFDVLEVQNGTRVQIAAAIDAVKAALSGKQGVGVLYYAGHGVQLDWHNYMVPVDATLATAKDTVEQSIDVATVLDAFRAAGNRINIIILDACRDNPFGRASSGKGLAQLDAPSGTFLAYATAPGNVADDGPSTGGHGLYTGYLVEELKRPDAKIEDVFKRVRVNVRQQSNGRQIPWESTSLEDDFYFGRNQASGPMKSESTTDAKQLASLQSKFTVEKEAWDRIRDSRNPVDFLEYLKTYPNGFIAEQAQFRLDQLQPVLPIQPKKDEMPPLASGEARFKVGDQWTFERVDHLGFTTREIKQVVTAADDRRVEINRGRWVWDQMGSVLKDGFGQKDPGVLLSPSELSVGKRWRTAWVDRDNGRAVAQSFYDAAVVAMETIEVPAGKFKTFKIQFTGLGVRPEGNGKNEGTLWIDPTNMLTVKAQWTFYWGGKRSFDITDSLTSLKLRERP